MYEMLSKVYDLLVFGTMYWVTVCILLYVLGIGYFKATPTHGWIHSKTVTFTVFFVLLWIPFVHLIFLALLINMVRLSFKEPL